MKKLLARWLGLEALAEEVTRLRQRVFKLEAELRGLENDLGVNKDNEP